ncbi:MAG TPA: chitobiase/beta-hexosaminidase C-terminal domain-containing protein [Steroidobacteraceae bacterium]|nr:chitobiase/beta-hexosaminidase C-terminal domain-containing protein [Steroidobacteraceae bacterium]
MELPRRRFLVMAAVLALCSPAVQAQVSVTTYHNDNARTGQNTQETALTPANVNSGQFGKLFTITVDGVVYAQPLYLSNVGVGGGTHNAVYVATQHDSIYAFDADTGRVYWQKSLIPAGGSTANSTTDLGCNDIEREVGVTGTPVIDSTNGTLYAVAKVKLNGAILQYLHALDVSTGAEKFAGPVNIQAMVPGKAGDGDGTMVTFNPRQENQRAALLLVNGHVVIGWSAHCDEPPWHGWVMSYGATTLILEGTYIASPNGAGNGIWMSGGGLAADPSGNVYVATGNGPWNAVDRGNSILKLGPPSGATLPLVDYFTPFNQSALTGLDDDLSAGGLILLPPLSNGKQLLTIIGKAGTIYLADRNNLGKYCPALTPACTTSNTNIVQEIPGAFSGLWSAPAYWNGNLYWASGNENNATAEPLKAFSFNANNSGLISTTPTSVSAKAFIFAGPVPSISANGSTNGIIWGLDNSEYRSTCLGGTACQVLYAYDATNLGKMLYNSDQAANNRDVPGSAVKFTTPTVANGKVYVPTGESIAVFGLLNGAASTATAPTFSPAGGTFSSTQTVTLSDTTRGAVIYYTTNGSTPTTSSAKYATALTIGTTTTVKAIAAATGYYTSAVSSATYDISFPGSSSSVDLAAAFNVFAIFNNGSAVTNGGLDTHGSAYSANLLGSSVNWAGVTFKLGTAGAASAVAGSTLTLTAGNFATLNLLATGLYNQVDQVFVVTYTDGSTTTLTQSLSNWGGPQNYSGESIAVTMAYKVGPTGSQHPGPFYVYGYAFAIDPTKTVKSITLPGSRYVVVLAVTLSGAVVTPPGGAVTTVNLTPVANVSAMSYDGQPVANGGLDVHGNAYSKNLLGASLVWSGVTFTLGAGVANAASSISIPLPVGNFGTLELLATGLNGNQANQTLTVTYTDGTTTRLTQSFSDWWASQGYAGESIASVMAYRLDSSGVVHNGRFCLYGYSFAIDSAKTVKSLTLPGNRGVVLLAAELLPGSIPQAVSLGTGANVNAIFNDGSAVTNGGLDFHSQAYSGKLLGRSLKFSGVSYNLLGPGVPDAVRGATVALPAGHFSTLNLLAASVNGNHASQTFTVTYTDGSTTIISQSLSDWYTPQHYSGESIALTMAYHLDPAGAAIHPPVCLYAYSLAIDNAKAVKSVTLPATLNVVVLAATLTP